MNYYALQVKTGAEERFIRLFRARNPDVNHPLHFPRRLLDIRRGGVEKPTMLSVFPGYVFLELGADEDIRDAKKALRGTDGFYRFLPSNRGAAPLHSRDLELVLHFIRHPLAEKSVVRFDENSRIAVLSGALSGLEGRIIKVDKRKRRAKVKLDLYGDSFCIDLAFEVLVKGRD